MESKLIKFVLGFALVAVLVALGAIAASAQQVNTTCHRNGDDVECTSTDMTPAPDSDYRQGAYGPVYCGYKNCAADYRQGPFGPIYDSQLAAQHAYERAHAQSDQARKQQWCADHPWAEQCQ